MRIQITRLPIFDKQTYKKIRAFVWIFDAYKLLHTGYIDKESPFYMQVDSAVNLQKIAECDARFMSIKQWTDFIKYHNSYMSIFPELKNHSIVMQLDHEVQKATQI